MNIVSSFVIVMRFHTAIHSATGATAPEIFMYESCVRDSTKEREGVIIPYNILNR